MEKSILESFIFTHLYIFYVIDNCLHGLYGCFQGNDWSRKLGFLSLQVPQTREKTTSPFPNQAKIKFK